MEPSYIYSWGKTILTQLHPLQEGLWEHRRNTHHESTYWPHSAAVSKDLNGLRKGYGCCRKCYPSAMATIKYQREWEWKGGREREWEPIQKTGMMEVNCFSLGSEKLYLHKSENVSCSVMSESLQPHELYSPPASSVHGILQARILEWVAILQGSPRPRDWTRVFCIAG